MDEELLNEEETQETETEDTVVDPLLTAAKLALRITTNAFDNEVEWLLEAAKLDLGIAGVLEPDTMTAIVQQACITYVKMNFGIGQDYEMTYKQIAEAEGCTQERVRQIIVSALKKMKN